MGDGRTFRWTALLVAAGATVLLSAGAQGEPQARTESAQPIGLQVITFRFAHHTGVDDCPKVITNILPTFLERYVDPKHRDRLRRPENNIELNILANNAPGRSDLCSAPDAYLAWRPDYPSLPLNRGKVAFGMNLDGTEDGRATPKTCAHPNYRGLKGEPGIDNQLYRAIGCNLNYRFEPRALEDKVKDPFDYDVSSNGNKPFAIGEQNYLIRITPKPAATDGAVEVEIMVGRNSVVMGGNGRPVPWTTQTIDPDPRFQHRVAGRLVAGRLTTEPFDLRLRRRQQAFRGVFTIRDARLDLEIRPDGSAKGLVAGYFPIEDIYWFLPAGQPRLVTASDSMECPGMYRAMYEQADGYPDPETGQCTALSGAMAVELIPAFIVAPEKSPLSQADAAQTAKD